MTATIQAQHAAGALERHQRRPIGVQAAEDLRMDRIGRRVFDQEEHVGDVVAFGAPGQACSTSKAAKLRASLLNSTPIRWMGSPRSRYLSA